VLARLFFRPSTIKQRARVLRRPGSALDRAKIRRTLRPGEGTSLLQLAAGHAIVQRIALLGRQCPDKKFIPTRVSS
jgi:hypothetical protein